MSDPRIGPNAPPCLIERIDRRLALTAIGIGLTGGEPARMLTREPPTLRSWAAALIGRSQPNGLADPRLELLRAVAAGLRHRRRPLDPALLRVARHSGLGDAGLAWIELLAGEDRARRVSLRHRRTKSLHRLGFQDRR